MSLRPGGGAARFSLRPGGNIGIPCSTTPQDWPTGTRVLAKYAASSRTFKKAAVVSGPDGSGNLQVRFDGYSDLTAVPIERVQRDTNKDKDKRRRGEPRRPPQRPVPTQLPRATTPSEQAVGKARACVSKLSPQNFDKIAGQVVELDVDNSATLEAIVDLMYERACAESFFVDLYAKLFARCAAELPECTTEEGGTVTFRSLLLLRAQRDFEEGVGQGERKRKLGATIFLGHLWLKGLLTGKIIQGCVVTVLDAAEAPSEQEEGSGGVALQMEAVEVACTLLGVIGKESDESTAGRKRMDAHCARLRKLLDTGLKGRVRFKVMDVLELREKGW